MDTEENIERATEQIIHWTIQIPNELDPPNPGRLLPFRIIGTSTSIRMSLRL
jgi:hypothetical protein